MDPSKINFYEEEVPKKIEAHETFRSNLKVEESNWSKKERPLKI